MRIRSNHTSYGVKASTLLAFDDAIFAGRIEEVQNGLENVDSSLVLNSKNSPEV